ncbi:translation initiation factor IF-2-like [Panicum virgatum]|uniref:translation initiation factor IF-2-like n=1 Tax=Panicum virgatum TaxID=38727 RepID=UPI0019D51CEE|nr:translation initiation factor IF-2-like [Panicum virgatum]
MVFVPPSSARRLKAMTAALALAVLALAYAAAPARAQRCGAQAGGALCPQQPLMQPVRLLRPQLLALRRRLPEPVRPRRRGGASEATAAVRRAGRRRGVPRGPLLQPVRLLRPRWRPLRRRLPGPVRQRRRGGRADPGALRPDAAAPRRRRVPRARVLHLRSLPRRGPRVPGLRRHGLRRRAQAGGRRLPGAHLPRDLRWAVLFLGLLLQGGEGRPVGRRPLRAERAVALRVEQDVPCSWAHADLLQLQLRGGRGGHRRRPARRPGRRHGRPRRRVQDGAVAVDDPARAGPAVVPRRRHGAVGADAGGPGGRAQAGLRAHHEHPHRRASVRRHQRPRRVLQALLRRPRRQLRAEPGLRRPGAVRRRHQVRGAVLDVRAAAAGRGTPPATLRVSLCKYVSM